MTAFHFPRLPVSARAVAIPCRRRSISGSFLFKGNLGKTETARRSSYGEVRDKKKGGPANSPQYGEILPGDNTMKIYERHFPEHGHSKARVVPVLRISSPITVKEQLVETEAVIIGTFRHGCD